MRHNRKRGDAMRDERFKLSGGLILVAVKVAEPNVTILEVTLQPGAAAAEHVHTQESETIVVLEGSLEVSGRVLQSGETAHLAAGTPHSFSNDGGGVVRALFVCVPGGLERFFRAVANPDATEASIAAAVEAAGLRFS